MCRRGYGSVKFLADLALKIFAKYFFFAQIFSIITLLKQINKFFNLINSHYGKDEREKCSVEERTWWNGH